MFRLVSQHVDEFLRVYDERFAQEHGPLRPVVERVLRGFIRCGIPRHGFARVLCDTCRVTYAVPFSCRTRSFCPSCEKKRALLWAEWVRGELLEAVAHRHVVFTIPRLLRPLFRRRRELLSELGHAAAAAIGALMQEALGARVRPGVVVCVATAARLIHKVYGPTKTRGPRPSLARCESFPWMTRGARSARLGRPCGRLSEKAR